MYYTSVWVSATVFYFHKVSVGMHTTKHNPEPICFVSNVPLVWDSSHVTVVSF